jgi:rubrerythrin
MEADEDPTEQAEADEDEDEETQDTAEDEEDLEPEVEALLSLAQMDSEAAVSYELVAESASDAPIADMLRGFANDHRRHISDIKELMGELAGDVSFASPEPEDSTFATMAAALSQLGIGPALRALIAAEQFTNSAYETALDLVAEPDARAVIERNFRDEQRHLDALSQSLARADRDEERPASPR